MIVPRRQLGSTQLEISLVGYGGSPLGAMFNSGLNIPEAIRSVHEAFRLGVNLFDTSPFYGTRKSEQVLGEAFKTLPRKEIVVATKVGRYGQNEFDFSAKRVHESIQHSLEALHVDYLDIVQCHDIEFANLDQIVTETIPALQKAKASGLVRYIGITGLPLKIYHTVLDRIQPGTIDTVLSYCHHTLLDETLLSELPYLKSKGVGIINASALAMGLLSPFGPPDWNPAPDNVKEACKAARILCKEQNVNLAKLALHHCVQNEEISSTLVGMSTVAEVQANVATAAANATLSTEEAACLEDIQQLFKPILNTTWASGLPENN